ncbi:hypothetical protein K5549_005814 [Capra hircus]|nr:hypothetical protein K5549_005814 [Capra hircus]
MLRHQGLLKCRCRMLFNDLKVFLLRRPLQRPCPCTGNPSPLVWRPTTTPFRLWVPGGGQAGGALEKGSASSDDFCKGKAEDRYSLGSSLDSGMRTPLCRICFQGPEQDFSEEGRQRGGDGENSLEKKEKSDTGRK